MNKSLLSYLQDNKPTMIQHLYDFCSINSGSDNLLGLNAMREALQKAFSPLSSQMESSHLRPFSTLDMSGHPILQASGDTLLIRKRSHLKRRVLLSGHMDTVYGEHHPFQTLTQVHENQIIGPGVADMKGGLIVMLYALKAFETTPFASLIGWDVFLNADEELGSPSSGPLLNQLSTQYETALVFEPAMTPEGTIAKNRKGSGKLTLIATGKAAHAGRSFDEGRNAICHLAKAITHIQALNHTRPGVTLNVGQISGGEALNVVPDKAVVKLDVRISDPKDEGWVRKKLSEILLTLQEEGFSLTLHGEFGRPVKHVNQATRALFRRVQSIGKSLGLNLHWQDSGGCCDGNNLALHGIPVLDTLGVRGGRIHSSEEFILLDSLVERAALSALLLVELAKERVT
ncbi:MAG: hydrolase [Legionellales bacterium]|nr:hydrolase [Legionellales bacterium]